MREWERMNSFCRGLATTKTPAMGYFYSRRAIASITHYFVAIIINQWSLVNLSSYWCTTKELFTRFMKMCFMNIPLCWTFPLDGRLKWLSIFINHQAFSFFISTALSSTTTTAIPTTAEPSTAKPQSRWSLFLLHINTSLCLISSYYCLFKTRINNYFAENSDVHDLNLSGYCYNL